MLKAYKAFPGYAGGSAQAWLLAIVRNTCLTAIERRRSEGKVIVLADTVSAYERWLNVAADPAPLADTVMITQEERHKLHTAIGELPLAVREILVLREFHDLSYRQIADIVGAPVGTVMSRLARARERLAKELLSQLPRQENGKRS